MANGDLAGWWLKIDHGKDQAGQLELEVNLWMNEQQGDPPWRARPEYDQNLQCVRFFVDTVKPMPPRWGLLLGDALHNVRCALDHMAWHLVAIGDCPPTKMEDQRRIGFPIYDKPSTFSKAIGTRIPGVSSEQKAVIERHQPYRLGTAAGSHPLARLQDLNNTDKHRELRTLVAAKAGKFRFDLVAPMGSRLGPSEIIPAFKDEVLFTPGTEIVRAYGQFVEGELTYAFSGDTGIALDDGQDPKTTFDAIHAEATAVLMELEATL